MEKHICEMLLDQNRKQLRDSLQEACDYITPYDVQDMKRVFESQKAMVNDVLAKNSELVFHELRMHMSFLPVEYQDYVKTMQSSNHQDYRKQRATPKVIIPHEDHKGGLADIQLEDAQMSLTQPSRSLFATPSTPL
jgi:hypothetical protein